MGHRTELKTGQAVRRVRGGHFSVGLEVQKQSTKCLLEHEAKLRRRQMETVSGNFNSYFYQI